MKTHIKRWITAISSELELIEVLEQALNERDLRIKHLEAECSGLRNELTDIKNDNMQCHANVESVNVQLAQLKQALEIEVSKKRPTHYWEVTVKLPDGRLGTYSITDWPHHIHAGEIFRPDVTLSLHRIVR